jgi:hypothetical protein
VAGIHVAGFNPFPDGIVKAAGGNLDQLQNNNAKRQSLDYQ